MQIPQLEVCEDYASLSREAARRAIETLAAKPDLLLCAATGASPRRMYELLAETGAREPELFRALRVVKLDEWGGLAMDDLGTCETQIQQQLVRPLGISADRYVSFASRPADREAECARLARRLVADGPIDLCVLGLGLNGHLGMNEPAEFLEPRAHVAQLTETTLGHPMLRGSPSRPSFGLTLGMAEILASREILLLVSGPAKREPLRQLLRRRVTPHFPASFLWLHSRWTLLCDREAAEGIELPS